MSSLRPILALLAVVLFVFATNSCAIAAAFPETIGACCESDTTAPAHEAPNPCQSGDCPPCATLESGAQISALIPLSVGAVTWLEDAALGELLRLQTRAACEAPQPIAAEPAQSPPPTWRDFGIRALPVRGPSLG